MLVFFLIWRNCFLITGALQFIPCHQSAFDFSLSLSLSWFSLYYFISYSGNCLVLSHYQIFIWHSMLKRGEKKHTTQNKAGLFVRGNPMFHCLSIGILSCIVLVRFHCLVVNIWLGFWDLIFSLVICVH